MKTFGNVVNVIYPTIIYIRHTVYTIQHFKMMSNFRCVISVFSFYSILSRLPANIVNDYWKCISSITSFYFGCGFCVVSYCSWLYFRILTGYCNRFLCCSYLSHGTIAVQRHLVHWVLTGNPWPDTELQYLLFINI